MAVRTNIKLLDLQTLKYLIESLKNKFSLVGHTHTFSNGDLPIASTTVVGGIKIGSGLIKENNDTVRVNLSKNGGIINTNGELSVNCGRGIKISNNQIVPDFEVFDEYYYGIGSETENTIDVYIVNDDTIKFEGDVETGELTISVSDDTINFNGDTNGSLKISSSDNVLFFNSDGEQIIVGSTNNNISVIKKDTWDLIYSELLKDCSSSSLKGIMYKKYILISSKYNEVVELDLTREEMNAFIINTNVFEKFKNVIYKKFKNILNGTEEINTFEKFNDSIKTMPELLDILYDFSGNDDILCKKMYIELLSTKHDISVVFASFMNILGYSSMKDDGVITFCKNNKIKIRKDININISEYVGKISNEIFDKCVNPIINHIIYFEEIPYIPITDIITASYTNIDEENGVYIYLAKDIFIS